MDTFEDIISGLYTDNEEEVPWKTAFQNGFVELAVVSTAVAMAPKLIKQGKSPLVAGVAIGVAGLTCLISLTKRISAMLTLWQYQKQL